MIRYMASLGQSTDPSGPAYNKEGLPLIPGLIEVRWLSENGSRRADAPRSRTRRRDRAPRLARYTGGPKTQDSPVAWILGTAWIPYQLPTFVTPSFQGYVSGHSTFSRAAAEVLAGITGSEYFPGGLATRTVAKGASKSKRDRVPTSCSVGTLQLRRRGPGRPVASLRRDPRAGRRLHGADRRLDMRQGRVGTGAALLRRAVATRRAHSSARTGRVDTPLPMAIVWLTHGGRARERNAAVFRRIAY